MKKKLSVAVVAAMLSASMAIPTMAQWNQLGTDTWQWIENGAAVKDKWVTTVNGQYYINLDGYCSYNWINWNGNWYFGEQGANLGNILKNTWANIDGNVYYFFGDGKMATGNQTIDNGNFTFDGNGHCLNAPSGVSVIFNTASTNSGTTVVSTGGGSSSSATSEAKSVRDIINGNQSAMGEAVGGNATIGKATASGNVVSITINSKASDDTVAADLLGSALDAVNASGIADRVTNIKIRTVTADSVEEMAERVNAIVGDLTIAEIKKQFESSRTITVTLNDETIVKVTIRL